MLLSNKLQNLIAYQSDCNEFTVLRKGSFDYLTDRFDLYTDQKKKNLQSY